MGTDNQKEQTSEQTKAIAIILIIIFLSFILFSLYMTKYVTPEDIKYSEELNTKYFNSFNESFLGIIVDKSTTSQYAGDQKLLLLKIKLLSSSIKYYDPRDSSKFYFCVIDYPYAEVFFYEIFYTRISIGDSCFFNGENDQFYIKFNMPDFNGWYGKKPQIINPNNKFFENLFTIPKHKKAQKNAIDKKSQMQKEPDSYYRLYLGKFKTDKQFEILKKQLSQQSLIIQNIFKEQNYVTYKKKNTSYLLVKQKFKDYEKACQYREQINVGNVKVVMLNNKGTVISVFND